MRSKIVGLRGKISDFRYGYSYSQLQSEHWASVLNANVEYNYTLEHTDNLYIYIGADYFGKNINLYGGLTEGLYKQLKYISELYLLNRPMKIFSLEYDIPTGFAETLIKRLKNPSTYHEFTEEMLLIIVEMFNKCTKIIPENIEHDSIVFGDSHSFSIANNREPVKKMGGRTLFGVLRDNLLIEEYGKTNHKHLRFMIGSIDIRHHIFRQEDPFKTIQSMLEKYVQQCKTLRDSGKIITIHSPVPVEHELRKFSKANAYKGDFYYGSVEERHEMTEFFKKTVNMLIQNEYNIFMETYPEFWYSMGKQEYAEIVMEKPKGSHVAMKYCKRLNYGEQK